MNRSELTDMLVESSQQYNQAKFNPWWEGNHEDAIYRYDIFSRETLQNAGDCVAGCGKEELFAPVGNVGLGLFHLLVWHNFYDAVEELFRSGKIGREEVDRTDAGGHGLTSGESMEQLSDSGEAAVHIAARKGHLGMLKVMAEKGVDLSIAEDAPARAGMTPLHEACAAGHKDVVKMLMEAGADINLTDNEGNTALHHALLEYSEDTARYLVKKGADYNRPNNDGRTPADIAVERGFEGVPEVMGEIG